MTEKRVMKLASRGKRFGAAVIDAFVPVVSYLLYSAVMAANGIRSYYPGYGYGFGNDLGFGYGYGYGYGNGFGNIRMSGASAAIMMVVCIILLAYIVFELVLFAKGKSIGKAILGLQVVSSTDGKPFGFWKMFFREVFVKSASGSVFGLGYIWILLDEKNRGWHDKILDTYVVDLKESERMNYKRHIDQIRKASSAPDPEPVPVPEKKETETEVIKSEPVIPDILIAEEPVIEAVPGDAEIEIETETEAAAESVAEEPVEDEAAVEEASEDTAGEIAETVEESLSQSQDIPEPSMSMKREELLEAARQRGIQVSTRATKAAIIEAIEKAAEETEK